MNAKELVRDLAVSLRDSGQTIRVGELANQLNRSGVETSYGTMYQGGRGTYRLVRVTYDWLYHQGLRDEAAKVALTYVKPDGSYAYDHCTCPEHR